jgi:hypothetical protein
MLYEATSSFEGEFSQRMFDKIPSLTNFKSPEKAARFMLRSEI